MESNMAHERRGRLCCPLHGGSGADMGVALVAGETCVRLQVAGGVPQLVTEGSPQQEIALYVVAQHDGACGHGWAISRSRSKSTLA